VLAKFQKRRLARFVQNAAWLAWGSWYFGKGILQMDNEGGRSVGVLVAGLLLAVVVSGLALKALPLQVAAFCALWSLLSLPLGVTVGHCALGED
jgi:hypothetical protein